MKKYITFGLLISYLILGLNIDDFFLNTIWTFLFLIGFTYIGAMLIGSAEYILPWIIDKIHRMLIWVFNPQVINSRNFSELENKLEDNARWYVGIPYALGVLYFFLWTWEII